MNRSQKIAIVVGAVVIAGLALFPSWIATPADGDDRKPSVSRVITDLDDLRRQVESEPGKSLDGYVGTLTGRGAADVEMVLPMRTEGEHSEEQAPVSGNEGGLRLALMVATLAITVATVLVLKGRTRST